MCASGNQPGKVRHVDEVKRTNSVGDLAHAGEVNNSWVRAAAADDQFRTLPLGNLFQIVVVDGFSFFGHAIGNDLVTLARKVQMVSVGKVPAVSELQA